MNIKNIIIIAISLGIVLCNMTSCNFSNDVMKSMIRSKLGKDEFRDSEKWGKVITKPLDLSEFTHIYLSGNADINFKQGDSLIVKVYGNEKAIEMNDIFVEDGALHVSKKDGKSNLPNIKLYVTAPTVESICVAGAGDIDLKNDIHLPNDLFITVSGAGDVEIDKLTCQWFSVMLSGAGDFSAKKINSNKADISISGAGDVDADIKATNISIQVSGAGDANLKVACENVTAIASGAGDITLKGECAHISKSASGMSGIDSRDLKVKNNIDIRK